MPEQDGSSGQRTGGALYRLLRRVMDIEPAEVAAVSWAWLYFFAILSSYYVIRPIRDEIGAAGGVEKLPWLFTGTLLGMMLANPPFAALVARLSPVQFISTTYRFFMGNMLLFLFLLEFTSGAANVWAGRIFYIWGAVFNLFVVSVFWGFMVDVFTNKQGRRLFGMIAAGGTLGGIAGSALTSGLATHVSRSVLLLSSLALLELAVFAVKGLSRVSKAMREHSGTAHSEHTIGGSSLAGVTHAIKSPYLLNISLYMALFTVLSTFLYFQQAAIAVHAFPSRGTRTAFFADVDLAVNILTLLIQLFLTGRILRVLGVAVTLTLLPLVSMLGFGALGLAPTLWALVLLQVFRRAGNFAVARPTREILFTVLPREDKYKAKGLIDTFVYRTGDQIGAWSYALMAWMGLGVAGIAFAAVPISAVWLLNGLWLGRRQEKLAKARAKSGDAPASPAVIH
jgi:ATP:ADP antiporter, AAA family